MSKQSQHFGVDWDTETTGLNGYLTWDSVGRILLQEIRTEMKQMNIHLSTIRHFFSSARHAVGNQ